MFTTKCFHFMIYLIAFSVGLQGIVAEEASIDEFRFNSLDNNTTEVTENSVSWLKRAQDMFASPTGHVVTRVAKELLSRSTGNNQVRSDAVLSLNLTNLLIILMLKVLIFTAAFLGAGHLGYGGYGYGYNYARSAGRSENGYNFGLSDGEDSIITAFLAAQGSGIDDCLYTAACSNPDISQKYTKAAKALLEGIQKFEGSTLSNPRYNDLIALMEKATYDGLRGLSCNTTTDCSNFV